MIINREQVEHVALLARLDLSEEEIMLYTDQLNAILDYVGLLDQLDTSQAEAMAHILPLSNVFRADQVRPPLAVEDALANAPDRKGEYFRVPRIV